MENVSLISIIIPTYGRPKFLKRSVNSVLEQDYRNIEVIIVDDNGTGNEDQLETEKIVKKIINYDKRVKYIAHEKNKNGSAARNTGIKNANGEYLCFLDDDDEFLDYKLSKQVSKLEDLGKEWVACYTGHTRVLDKFREQKDYYAELEGNILYNILKFEIDHVSGSSLMVRRAVVEKNINWNESLRRHQDYEFIAQIAKMGKIAVIREPMVMIYSHEGSYRQKKFKDIEKSRLSYLESIINITIQFSEENQKEIVITNYYWLFKKAIQYRNITSTIKYLKLIGLNKYIFRLVYYDFIRIIFK